MQETENIWEDWKIDEQIGQGEYTKVYQAKRENFNQTFYSAIKVITIPKNGISEYAEDGMSQEELRDYYKEYVNDILKRVTLLEELKGAKNIVSIEDCKLVELPETLQWKIYLRMDLLTNTKKYFLENKPTYLDIINLGLDICEALASCEKTNIIHGNIKPENIFVTKFKEYKLGDFMLAQKIGTESSTMSKNDYLFSAPEVYRNYEPDKTADIYALGMIMYYFMNNNRAPFMPEYPNKITPRDINKTIIRRINGETIPKTENIPQDIYEILKKMCAFKPEDRYQSIAELKRDLKNIEKSHESEKEDDFEKTVSIFSKRREEAKKEQAKKEIEVKPQSKKEVTVETEQEVQPIVEAEPKTENKQEPAEEPQTVKKDTKQPKRKNNVGIIVIAIIIVAVIAGLAIYVATGLNREPQQEQEKEQVEKVVVPNVVDMKYDIALTILTQIGFEVEKEEIETTEKETGTVISQSLEHNTTVETGTKILLKVVK